VYSLLNHGAIIEIIHNLEKVQYWIINVHAIRLFPDGADTPFAAVSLNCIYCIYEEGSVEQHRYHNPHTLYVMIFVAPPSGKMTYDLDTLGCLEII
jgi:hypothetical protein